MISANDNTIASLALKEYGQVSPRLFQQLLMIYGEPDNIFDNDPEEIASMAGINMERAQKIAEAKESFEDIYEMVNHLNSINISVVSIFDSAYPESLRKIVDPPIALYVKGDKALLEKGGVAIVGATSADQTGLRAAADFARELSDHGQTIISGLAAGIDSAAHLSCLKNNGKTIAALGCGHLNIYPEENVPLARLIAESGAVVSEFDVHADAIPRRLISRNRIIAALADIVILAQIGEDKKGELYTARAAVDQCKPVYVYDPEDKYDSETLLNNLIIKVKGLAEIDEILKYISRNS